MIKQLNFIPKQDAVKIGIPEAERVLMNLNSFKIYCDSLKKVKEQGDTLYLKENLKHTEIDCLKSRKFSEYCSTIGSIANNFLSRGLSDISSIFFSNLSKRCITCGKYEEGIDFAKKACEIYKSDNDMAHYSARLTDLEKIYRGLHKPHKLYNVLKKKDTVLSDILENYDTAKGNFKSLHKNFPEKETFKIQLAMAKSDIGDLLLRKNPNKAIQYYKEAVDYYKQAGKLKQADFIQYRIDNPSRIKIRNY